MRIFINTFSLILLSLSLQAQVNPTPPKKEQILTKETSVVHESEMYKKAATTEAPKPKKEAHEMTEHGDTRIDNYYWMKLSDEQKNAKKPDAQTQEVLDYLNAENDYKAKLTDHLDGFEVKLFEEMKGRIKQTDMSVPYKKNGYFYITRFEEGKEYPIYSRKKGSLKAEEEIMLNVNELAKDYEYFNVSGRNVSPDNKILCYGEDTLSRRIYKLKFKSLVDGKMHEDVIENTTGYCVWANDNETLFYVRKDDALRPYKIFKHKLGTDPSTDKEVFHEADDTFNTYVSKTKSKKYIVIGSYATVSNEYYILDANDPDGEFKLFTPRERELEHSISHYNDKWYIITNKDKATNFKLMTCPLDKTTKDYWSDFIPHNPNVLLSYMEIFKDYYVLGERANGYTRLRVVRWDGTDSHEIDFGEEVCTVYSSTNPDFDQEALRVGFTSMTTPNSTYDYSVAEKKFTLLKEQEVLGDFDKNLYTSERMMAKAQDGSEVPISLVYKKGLALNANTPVLLYAYGSYGNSMDPYFSSARLSLLDRGFVYAMAHIRGGQEMGRNWYEDGKMLNKKNTFTDFIDCADHLISQGYTSSDKLFALGGSAGGLLMGAVLNMRPELWKGVIAAVPFVDVVTTMLDETIPLTTGEFDEWGNPKEKEYYDYIKSYSPYDNVKAVDYPAILVTTGYHDSQVQYWEPAKWVAKLREYKTDKNPLILHTNMGAGHGGKSGRYERLKEVALEYAFLLDLAGWQEPVEK